MFKKKHTSWPEVLIEETRIAFQDINNSKLKDLVGICMKRYKGDFGFIYKNDVENANFVITHHNQVMKTWKYDSLEDMLSDGWVVD